MAIPKLNQRLTKSLIEQQVDQRVLADRVAALETLIYYVAEYVLINGLEESAGHLQAYMDATEKRWQEADSKTVSEPEARLKNPSEGGRSSPINRTTSSK